MLRHLRLALSSALIIVLISVLGACGGPAETPAPEAPAVEEPAAEEPEMEEPEAEEPEVEEPEIEEPTVEEEVDEEEAETAEATPVAEEEAVEEEDAVEEEEDAVEEEEAADDEEAAGEAGELNEVSYTATDYEFSGPDTVSAGWTRIELVNEGENVYHAQWLRFAEGMTLDDLMAAMQEGEEEFPEWLITAGGPSAVMPGETTSAIVNLQPGSHVMISLIPDPEGIPGIERGMLFPVEVTEAEGPAAAEPEADFTIDMADFSFDIPDTFEAGEYLFRANNNGVHPHEAILIQLAPDATVEEFLASMEPGGPGGPPPGSFMGGLQVIESGEHGYFPADLAPGDYALICFHVEPESGLPHFVLGMVAEFAVE